MLVRATRTLSALTMRGLFYGALFLVVVIVHVALTGALRQQGWNGGASLFVSGAVVLGLVLLLVNLSEWVRERRAAAREMERMRQGLPSGPTCVVRPDAEDNNIPWKIIGPIRARYPKLARRLGVEGFAVVDFEVSAQGTAKNMACVDAWPSDVFYEAARDALAKAKFEHVADEHPRFGASYQMSFVFRIAGAANLKWRARHSGKVRSQLKAAVEAVENVRRSA
ncbi:TonB family protein [Terricaulis sp.]|uniref:TonB family protein n=1 Tax=Terricaulis sp. TaxID=2768686 RepID=UPI003784B849